MPRRYSPADRDRAFRSVRLWTGLGAAGALCVTGAVAVAAAAGFAATVKPSSAGAPRVPVESAPVQSAAPTPRVVTKIVHVPAGGSLRPPAAAPGAPSSGGGRTSAPPPPPPPPACHSTPSHPC